MPMVAPSEMGGVRVKRGSSTRFRLCTALPPVVVLVLVVKALAWSLIPPRDGL